jgi:hypothetical protein
MMHPPPHRPQRPPVLALYGAATLLDAEGQVGSSNASVVATSRFVFIVPHRATIVPLVTSWLPQQRAVGPSEQELAVALQAMLSSSDRDIPRIESWLATHLAADQVLELADLRDYKVGTSGMQRGFYYKRRGAFTWEGMDLAPAAAEQLLGYLPSPAEAKAANPQVAYRRVETRPTPGARLQGVFQLFGGLALLGAGLATGVISRAVLIPTFIVGMALIASGLTHLVLAKPVDLRTGQPTGRWRSRLVIAILAGVIVGCGLLGPAFMVTDLIGG